MHCILGCGGIELAAAVAAFPQVLGRLAGSGNNLQSITGLPSLRPSYMTVEEATFTSRSGAEVQRMLDMDKKLQPSGPGGRSSASPAWSKVEKVLGFKLSGLS